MNTSLMENRVILAASNLDDFDKVSSFDINFNGFTTTTNMSLLSCEIRMRSKFLSFFVFALINNLMALSFAEKVAFTRVSC